MADEQNLSAVLSEFARTVITDFPIQKILDHLVQRIVGVLPITAAGVTLISDDRKAEYIAASDASALRFEQLQSEVGEGPCLEAYQTGEAVAVPDVATDGRFPRFSPLASTAGLGAVFTFPLRHGDVRIGALDLYRTSPGPLDEHDMDTAQTLADVTAAYLLNARAREEANQDLESVRHSSLHDPLTGLPNRQLLQERLTHASDLAKRSHTKAAVLFVDLDRFKDVNDQHGHHAGDALLRAVSDRLSHLIRDGDTLARVSGDEFVLFCENISSPKDVEDLAERIGASFKPPFSIFGRPIAITASVGIAFAGAGADITDELITRADVAMYAVKRRGGADHQIHDLRTTSPPAMDPPLLPDWRDEESFAADLREAMDSGAIYVAYQPIFDLDSERIRKVEALARWDHPVRGAISPGTFIPLAERHGLIDELGAWVLQRSCAGIVEIHRSGIDVDLTVNVSATQLHHPDVVECVAEVLEAAGLDAHRLWIEVTEGVLVDDRAIESLHRLHDLGVRLAIDDFGTGYASLQYLTRLSVDALKIDMSFVRGLGVNVSDTAIIRSVIGLGRELGVRVIAEGVETESQRAQLVALECRLGQGWLLGHAVQLDEFIRARRQGDAVRPVIPAGGNERLRLAALEACRVLDTDHENAFDSLARLASRLLGTPIALISLVDAQRQWFKASIGVDVTETPRGIAFCSHAIEVPDQPFVIPDTELDDRFCTNPFVTGPPNIRAYAGIPICSREGLALGTLCVLDTAPRTFSDDDLDLLTALAEQAATLLDLRRRVAELHTRNQLVRGQALEGAVAPALVAGA
ncbi:MAG: EAL domain-containing protein [Acidimicrobiales bacterium]